MASFQNRRLRRPSLILLCISVGMLASGMTVLKPHLTGWAFAMYWSFCLIITGAVIIVAMFELRAIRRDARRAHHALIINTLRGAVKTDAHISSEKDGQQNRLEHP
ncbi:MAG: hypothetical protein RMH97_01885 [Verrucomicrobiales bacterium]|nr:hypothetical protein [Verrucomicrobiales bacterium]